MLRSDKIGLPWPIQFHLLHKNKFMLASLSHFFLKKKKTSESYANKVSFCHDPVVGLLPSDLLARVFQSLLEMDPEGGAGLQSFLRKVNLHLQVPMFKLMLGTFQIERCPTLI